MPTDFRDGKTFPRRGREPLGKFLWLARVFDKGRAASAGTIFDYKFCCSMDRGVFERWGVSGEQFERAVAEHSNDDAILKWARGNISDAACEAANTWVLNDKRASLDRQDAEEFVSQTAPKV